MIMETFFLSSIVGIVSKETAAASAGSDEWAPTKG